VLLGYDQYDYSHNFIWMCDVIFNLSAVFFFFVPEEIIMHVSTKKVVMAWTCHIWKFHMQVKESRTMGIFLFLVLYFMFMPCVLSGQGKYRFECF
jgi:hypothetical protein